MMKRVTSNFLPAVAALVALLVAGWSQAAVITLSYVNGAVSTTSNFAAGTTTAVSAAQMTNGSLAIPSGQFFRFGVAAVVTGNPNPEAGSAWDAAAQNTYGTPPMPANLGLSTLGIKVLSSSADVSVGAPLSNGGKTRALFNNTGFSWTSSDVGDVTGGNAGEPSSIFRGQGPANVQDPTFTPKLGYYTTVANFVNTLPYSINTQAPLTLSLTMDLLSTSLWDRTAPGSDDGGGGVNSDPSYTARFLNSGDNVASPSPILINIPEPASIGMLGVVLVGMLSSRRRAN
jgi:hypothetical protein